MIYDSKRLGAGGPKGSPSGRESANFIRPLLSCKIEFKSFSEKPYRAFPLYSSKVRAGFPSPADDYIETLLNLNEYLIKHPASTFFLRASGDSMKNAGIHAGDLLIVDKSLAATHGKIVIAAIDGQLTVKRLTHSGGRTQLLSENSNYKPIDINETQDLVIWGVVTYVIHQPN